MWTKWSVEQKSGIILNVLPVSWNCCALCFDVKTIIASDWDFGVCIFASVWPIKRIVCYVLVGVSSENQVYQSMVSVGWKFVASSWDFKFLNHERLGKKGVIMKKIHMKSTVDIFNDEPRLSHFSYNKMGLVHKVPTIARSNYVCSFT